MGSNLMSSNNPSTIQRDAYKTLNAAEVLLAELAAENKLERKRAADRKYYASPKGRINRWKKGDFDARDKKLRRLARWNGLSVVFTSVDTVQLKAITFDGDVQDAISYLSAR